MEPWTDSASTSIAQYLETKERLFRRPISQPMRAVLTRLWPSRLTVLESCDSLHELTASRGIYGWRVHGK